MWHKTWVRVVLFLGLVGLPLGLWAFWLEPASLTTELHTVAVPRWPASCAGLKVAVVPDLHIGAPHVGLEKLDRVVEAIEAVAPDLVLLPGDFVINGVLGGSFVPPEPVAERLGHLNLTVPFGVFAVLGNHDWWVDGPRVMKALKDGGIGVLEDTSLKLSEQGCSFYLVGISDWWEGAHDVKKALEGVPEGAPVLAFTHNPDLFPELPARVNLTLAGHTHGGQVDVPGYGPPIVPSQYGQRYAKGHVVEDGRHLFVATGVGTSILPVRFRVPPEVTVVTLTPSE